MIPQKHHCFLHNSLLALPLAAVLCLSTAPSARGAVSFVFDYSDPSAELLTPEARAAMASAGQRVASYFTNYTAEITIAINAYHDPVGASYADAGTNWNLTGGTPDFRNPGVVGAKIRSNGAIDQNGPVADGYININMGDWYGYSDSVDGSMMDFTAMIMHELGHPLGFFSNISQEGTTLFEGYHVPYSEFLTDSTGQRIVRLSSESGLWEVDVPLWLQASTGGSGKGLFFNGPSAVAANGGNLVPLLSPETWVEGSSMHHPDSAFFTNSVMSGWGLGTGPRAYSAVELGMLRDMGYTQIVPEPGATALALCGLLQALTRRRRH